MINEYKKKTGESNLSLDEIRAVNIFYVLTKEININNY